MSDPEVIYLQPRCPACACDRLWCEDDLQGEWCDGWDGGVDGCTANNPSVKYIRADIADAQLAAERERVERLREAMWEIYKRGFEVQREEHRIARAALDKDNHTRMAFGEEGA